MRFADFFKYIYIRLARINDSPNKISFGVSIGVFFGVLPFAGPVISFFVASILRANKMAALAGCLFVNTWISLLCAAMALKIGSIFFGMNFTEFSKEFSELTHNFSLSGFFKLTSGSFFFPFLAGFIVVALSFSLISFIASRAIIFLYKKFRSRSKIKIPREK